MEERKRKDFRRLLVTLDAQRDRERSDERRKAIEANRAMYRFQEVVQAVVLPTLRDLMADLEKRGHLTRLTRKTAERVRLDVQIQAGKAQRCALELSVHQAEPGQVRLRYGWGWREGDQEVVPLDRLDAGFVTDRVLRLLQAL